MEFKIHKYVMEELKLNPKMKDFHKRVTITYIDKMGENYYTRLAPSKDGKMEWVHMDKQETRITGMIIKDKCVRKHLFAKLTKINIIS